MSFGEVAETENCTVETYAGKVRIRWDDSAAVTAMGQMPVFIDFLKTSGRWDALVADCPLRYRSPNAPGLVDALGTLLMSVLAGQSRYAHITSLRGDGVNPELLGMRKVMSEDSARRAFKKLRRRTLCNGCGGICGRPMNPCWSMPGSWIWTAR